MAAFEIGLLVPLSPEGDGFAKVAELGMKTCHLCCWDPVQYNRGQARRIRQESESSGVQVAALWAGWTGKAVWDFLAGPGTLGIVPRPTRARRMAELKQGADFAALIGAPAIITHLGFIPENPGEALYGEVVEAVRELGGYCQGKNLGFWCESGQETPVTLLRLIEDIGLPNLGINFDTANVVLYGKANPADAVEVFGKYVRSVHAKDGLYPTNGHELGREVPLGAGKADFPAILRRLKELDFTGPVIIEREISGPQQIKDIKHAFDYLRRCLGDLEVT